LTDFPRLDPEREKVLRDSPDARRADDVPALLGELDFVRGELVRSEEFANGLRLRLNES